VGAPPMTLTIVGGVLTLVSLVISYLLTDRSRPRKIIILVGVVGLALSLVQGYWNQQRVHDLQARITPRGLRDDQKQQFSDSLLGEPGHSVVIVSPVLDHEAGDFSDRFVKPFRDGKWTVSSRVTNWLRPEDGVTIRRVDEKVLPGEKALDSALTSAGIKHRSKQITGDDTHAISPWFTSGTLYLLIGAKPKVDTQ
jgi:hypothetical protein